MVDFAPIIRPEWSPIAAPTGCSLAGGTGGVNLFQSDAVLGEFECKDRLAACLCVKPQTKTLDQHCRVASAALARGFRKWTAAESRRPAWRQRKTIDPSPTSAAPPTDSMDSLRCRRRDHEQEVRSRIDVLAAGQNRREENIPHQRSCVRWHGTYGNNVEPRHL